MEESEFLRRNIVNKTRTKNSLISNPIRALPMGQGACVATQRIAYLNTNALQQLHTYFAGTLLRPYDLVKELSNDRFVLKKNFNQSCVSSI